MEEKNEEKKDDSEEKKDAPKKNPNLSVLFICHARELDYQMKREYDRFARNFAWVKIGLLQ